MANFRIARQAHGPSQTIITEREGPPSCASQFDTIAELLVESDGKASDEGGHDHGDDGPVALGLTEDGVHGKFTDIRGELTAFLLRGGKR